jgi:hypothetical protein
VVVASPLRVNKGDLPRSTDRPDRVRMTGLAVTITEARAALGTAVQGVLALTFVSDAVDRSGVRFSGTGGSDDQVGSGSGGQARETLSSIRREGWSGVS